MWDIVIKYNVLNAMAQVVKAILLTESQRENFAKIVIVMVICGEQFVHQDG